MLVITIAKIYLTIDFLSDLNLDIHSEQYKTVAVINPPKAKLKIVIKFILIPPFLLLHFLLPTHTS